MKKNPTKLMDELIQEHDKWTTQKVGYHDKHHCPTCTALHDAKCDGIQQGLRIAMDAIRNTFPHLRR